MIDHTITNHDDDCGNDYDDKTLLKTWTMSYFLLHIAMQNFDDGRIYLEMAQALEFP